MGGIFTDLERKIIMTSKEVCRNALIASAAEIKIDIDTNICYRVSNAYYEEYTPSRYHRMKSLYEAWKIRAFLSDDRIGFNLNLDSDRLPQHKSRSKFHQSGSEWISRYSSDFNEDSDDNGMPENSWILTNFFEGIHPRYTFKDGLIMDESYEGTGVLRNMSKYIKEYKASGKMQKILIKHLKNQCKKI